MLRDWVLALAPLELPIYIYLELADRALDIEALTEMEKVNIIQRVMDSYRRVVRARAAHRRHRYNLRDRRQSKNK